MTALGSEATGTDEGRAVSDLIGFTLMFSIIILGVGIVSIGGVSQLTELSDAEEVRSAERGMESAAATLESMNRQNDLNRTFSIALQNGDLWLNETGFNVTSPVFDDTVQINSLEHRFGRTTEDITVRYEGGAVFRSDGAFPRYEPAFRCRDDGTETTAIVNILNLTIEDSVDGISVSSGYNPDLVLDEYSVPSEAPIANFDRAIDFRANVVDTRRHFSNNAMTVLLNTSETAGPDHWDRHFNDTAWDPVTAPSESHTFECNADRTLVRVTTIQLEILNLPFG